MVTLSAIVPATNRPSTLGACCTALGVGASVTEETVVVEEPSHVNAAGALSALVALVGTVSLVRRRLLGAAASAAALVALNRSFDALLWRRRGPVEATTGVFLRALHHLPSLAAVSVGVLLHLFDRPRRPR